uniref:response regulator n=1 Tax=Paractinoplanes polyasparticus TaxID=2856853 RepID=UPI001C8668C1|nr:response regulator [Actinoplanes polyasparticus]
MIRRWCQSSYHTGRFRAAHARRWMTGRMLAAWYVSSVGVLTLFGTAAYLGIGAVLAEREPVDRTYQALDTLSRLRSQLHDAQRGQRGFVLTADEHYLQPYTAAVTQMPGTLAELRLFIDADTARQPMIDDLQTSAVATLDYLGHTVTLLRTDGFTAARPAVLGTVGAESLARAEQLLDTLRENQLAVLHAQQQHAADQADSAIEMMIAAVAAAAGLVALNTWWITRSRRRATAGAGFVTDPGTTVTDAGEQAPCEQQDAWHAPLRVLLAEDNQVNQKVAQFMLAKLGHRVDTVTNGLEAVQALRTADYDVVLMDVQMPVLDGLEATRLIRSEFPVDRQPHIIAMTASVLIEDRTACRAAGMNDYLPKPVRLPDLTSALTPLLLAGPGIPAGDDATAPLPAVTPEWSDGDRDAAIRARLAEISDGEPTGAERDLLALLLTSFTAATPTGIDQLAQLITAGDVTGVRNQAHALNGSATNIGVTRLAQLLAAVEADARAGRLPQNPAAITAIRIEYDATAPVCERIAADLAAPARR